MKKFKYLCIVFSIFLLVGCNKEYNLTVTDNKITEEVNVIIENTNENKEILDLAYYPLHADTSHTYQKKITQKGKYLNVNLKYDYSPEEFSNANSFNQCFDNKKVVLDNDDYYYFKLSKMNGCITDSNVDINIITNNKVVLNNADSIKGNKYTWHVTNANKDSIVLEIKIMKGNHSQNSNNYINYIVISAIILFITIISILAVNKRKKSNKF